MADKGKEKDGGISKDNILSRLKKIRECIEKATSAMRKFSNSIDPGDVRQYAELERMVLDMSETEQTLLDMLKTKEQEKKLWEAGPMENGNGNPMGSLLPGISGENMDEEEDLSVYGAHAVFASYPNAEKFKKESFDLLEPIPCRSTSKEKSPSPFLLSTPTKSVKSGNDSSASAISSSAEQIDQPPNQSFRAMYEAEAKLLTNAKKTQLEEAMYATENKFRFNSKKILVEAPVLAMAEAKRKAEAEVQEKREMLNSILNEISVLRRSKEESTQKISQLQSSMSAMRREEEFRRLQQDLGKSMAIGKQVEQVSRAVEQLSEQETDSADDRRVGRNILEKLQEIQSMKERLSQLHNLMNSSANDNEHRQENLQAESNHLQLLSNMEHECDSSGKNLNLLRSKVRDFEILTNMYGPNAQIPASANNSKSTPSTLVTNSAYVSPVLRLNIPPPPAFGDADRLMNAALQKINETQNQLQRPSQNFENKQNISRNDLNYGDEDEDEDVDRELLVLQLERNKRMLREMEDYFSARSSSEHSERESGLTRPKPVHRVPEQDNLGDMRRSTSSGRSRKLHSHSPMADFDGNSHRARNGPSVMCRNESNGHGQSDFEDSARHYVQSLAHSQMQPQRESMSHPSFYDQQEQNEIRQMTLNGGGAFANNEDPSRNERLSKSIQQTVMDNMKDTMSALMMQKAQLESIYVIMNKMNDRLLALEHQAVEVNQRNKFLENLLRRDVRSSSPSQNGLGPSTQRSRLYTDNPQFMFDPEQFLLENRASQDKMYTRDMLKREFLMGDMGEEYEEMGPENNAVPNPIYPHHERLNHSAFNLENLQLPGEIGQSSSRPLSRSQSQGQRLSSIHGPNTQFAPPNNPMLNNQVPPGTRANNYWDNFRSYSRQNVLSSLNRMAVRDQGNNLNAETNNFNRLDSRVHKNPSAAGSSKMLWSSSFVENMGSKKRNKDQKVQQAPCRSNSASSIHSQVEPSNVAHVIGTSPHNSTHSRSVFGSSAQTEMQKDVITDEINLFIRQNSSRPQFLMELFQKLSYMKTDFLRQRTLSAMQELLTQCLSAQENEPPMGAEAVGGSISNRPRSQSEVAPSFFSTLDMSEGRDTTRRQSDANLPCSSRAAAELKYLVTNAVDTERNTISIPAASTGCGFAFSATKQPLPGPGELKYMVSLRSRPLSSSSRRSDSPAMPSRVIAHVPISLSSAIKLETPTGAGSENLNLQATFPEVGESSEVLVPIFHDAEEDILRGGGSTGRYDSLRTVPINGPSSTTNPGISTDEQSNSSLNIIDSDDTHGIDTLTSGAGSSPTKSNLNLLSNGHSELDSNSNADSKSSELRESLASCYQQAMDWVPPNQFSVETMLEDEEQLIDVIGGSEAAGGATNGDQSAIFRDDSSFSNVSTPRSEADRDGQQGTDPPVAD